VARAGILAMGGICGRSRVRAGKIGEGEASLHVGRPDREAADRWAAVACGLWVMGEESGRLRVWPGQNKNDFKIRLMIFHTT
jgi:hypothetical protein